MNLKLFAVLLFVGGIPFSTFAQFNETIRTGRPGQAIGAFTVGKGMLQVQSGFDYFRSSTDNGPTIRGFLNNTVVRVGLTEPFEVSALLEHKTEELEHNDVRTSHSGLSAMDVGMRYHILTGGNGVPNIGFQIRMRLPVLSEPYQIDDIAPRFIVATSQKLAGELTLITNWGAAWNGNTSAPRGTYVINLSFPFNSSVGSYVETFGGLENGFLSTNFDTGIAWLISNDLQLDLYGGYGDNRGVKDIFMSLGVSWRTK